MNTFDEYGLADLGSGKIRKRGFGSIEDAVVHNIKHFNSGLAPVMRSGRKWYEYTGR